MSVKTRTPKETIKIRRLPQKGDEVVLRATVTRTGRNTFGTADTVTLRIPGAPAPITIDAQYLSGEECWARVGIARARQASSN